MNDEPILIFGVPDPDALKQIQTIKKTADYVALMADHHVGYSMPIGGVAAYRNHVSPSCVGYDISCGNMAVKLDCNPTTVVENIAAIMDEVFDKISFGVGRKNKEIVDHELFDDDPAWDIPEVGKLKQLARDQLGTVGSGNHYVNLFVSSSGDVWVGVHFGSRGFGHKITTYFLEQAGGKDGMFVDPTLIEVDSKLGREYIDAMGLASRYAFAGREWVCGKVAQIVGGKFGEVIHNNHNLTWEETHFGETYWVVRKGATPAFPGQKGFVGSSMGEPSVILEGVDSELSRQTLYSTVHGAGRVMGRKEAAGTFKWKTVVEGEPKRYVQTKPGKISQSMMDEWVGGAHVELRGGGLDESPHAYKRLPEVLKAHEGTIKILETLTPIGVSMASRAEFDPYKD